MKKDFDAMHKKAREIRIDGVTKKAQAKNAIAHGLTRFAHKPCPKCKSDIYATGNLNCVPCTQISQKEYAKKNRDSINKTRKEWVKNNQDKIKSWYLNRTEGKVKYRHFPKHKHARVIQSIINNPDLSFAEIAEVHETTHGSVVYINKKYKVRGYEDGTARNK